MKKNYFLLSALLMFLSVGILNAQVSLYSFSAKPGTFTPIVGGTNLNSVDADDAISSPQPIGFTFNFDGSNHTQFRMSSNGFISFGSSTSSLSGNNLDFAGATSRPLIAPLWDDLSGSTNTKASYLLSGTAPNRILTVEWLNWQWRYNSADSAISFQVKLYETSNKVEFVYQQGPNPINSPTASIGLSGVGSGNGSYMSLENTGIFPSVRTTGGEISNLNTKPANGQVYIFEPPTCTPPSGLSASGITLTDATISWTAASAGWYYSIEYGPAGFTPGTGMTDTTRDTSINLTGLVGSTSYDVYVKSYCNLLDSSLSISFSFQTACAAVSSFPYKETFDGSSTTEVCWSVLNNNGDADQWNLNYTTNPFAGDQVAMMYTDFNSGNNDDYLISPQFVLTGNQRLKFQTRVQSSGEPNDYEVVLSSTGTSPSDFSTLILKDTVSSTTYNEVILDLSSYTGSYYIAIKIPNGGLDGWRLYIDDFIVEDIPTCLVPTALTSTNVSGDTADISWTDNNTTTPGSWQVSYGLQGFTVGTGTQVTMTADSGTLSGLMGSSDYDWYVRAICGSGDTSAWSSVGTFTTLCPTDTINYLQDFSVWPPDCWDMYATGSNRTALWRQNAGGFAEANFWGNNVPAVQNLISKRVYVNADSRLKFDWSHALNTSYPDSVEVQVRANGGTWNRVWGAKGTALNSNDGAGSTTPGSFVTESIALDPLTYNNKSVDVRIVAISGWGPIFYLDNLIIEKIPTCLVPTMLTTADIAQDSANISWTDINTTTPGSWQVSYGPSGFTAGSGTQVVVTADSTTLSGLTGNTNYDWYVRAICGGGDTSAWTSVSSFSTLCAIYTSFPFVETFNSSSTTEGCWTVINNNSDADLWNMNYTFNPFEGDQVAMMYTDFNGGNNDDYLISPQFALTGGQELIFQTRAQSTFEPNDYEIVLSSTGTNPADFTTIVFKDTVGSTTYSERKIDLSAYTGNYYIAIRVKSPGLDGWRLYIDNFTVQDIPTCTVGSGISGYNPTQVSHDVTWTPGAFDVSWEVEYGAPGYTPGTGTLVTGITNDSTTISGLISNTQYDVYFRGICSVGDTGAFVGPASIMTTPFPIVYDTTYPSNCYSYTTPLGGVTHTVSGLYFDTVQGTTPHVYDSAIHVYLATVNKLKTALQVISICDSLVTGSGKSLKATGVYLDTTTTAAGCDSILTIDLTITTTTYINTMATECDSVMWRGNMYYATGVLNDTVSTGSCDSIFIHNLTVNYATYATTTQFVCDSFVSPSGKVWKTDGMYMDTIPNMSGCDSVMTFNLTFGYISYASTTDTVCDMYMSPSGKVWTTSGTYLDTIVNASGCDSAMTFNLTINYNKAVTVSVTVCDSYTRPGGTTVNYSGTFIDVIPTTKGCDSTITTLLTVNYTTYSTTSVTSCDTWTSPSGKVIRYSGTVYDTITNTMGCDSLMVFNLTIKASTSETRTVDACFTYTQPETGNVYSTSGTYTDVVTNAAGCNHTITTILTINTANAGTLSVSGITLTCSAVGVTYKWVDCDNDYSYILGATSQSYTPIRNGNYACWVTTPEGCTDTTGMCMSINSVSLEEFEITESDINIYPNPATDFVTVDILSQNIEEDVTIKMFDAIGKLVYSQEVSSTNNKVTFDVSQFENGVYTVTVSNEFFLTTKKVVVSK